MFEHLRKYVVENEYVEVEQGNSFYPLKPDETDMAEKKLGFQFPHQLKRFYEEIGYGFLVRS